MTNYIIRRLFYGFFTVIFVSILVFVLTHVVTNPVNNLLPLEASQEERDALTHKLGLDKPVLVQLKDYAVQVMHGDLGVSWWQQRSNTDIIVERIPATLLLVTTSFIFALIMALILGILAAIKPRSWLDKLCSTGSLVGVCIPNFWLGIMLVIIFGVRLGWFYTSGIGTWKHLVLPAITLGILPLGRLTQIVRSAMLDQLREQYILTARSKGLSEMAVVVKHALKNAGGTVATMSGWEFGRMLAGYTVVVEIVFGWPGMGHLVVDTIGRADLPLLQALTVMIALMITALNLIIDLSYPIFDPRVKYE